jgi:uncharacterized protein
MVTPVPPSCTAFLGPVSIASGPIAEVALAAKNVLERDPGATILVFDNETSRQVELDLRGTVEAVVDRYTLTPRLPGRPKLGVIAREVTLLPRHWEWLAGQPGGASVALRKLVDEARWTHSGRDRIRRSQESAYRFMSVIAGNFPGFEEAARALFARDAVRFAEEMRTWPPDIKAHAICLATDAMSAVEFVPEESADLVRDKR